MKRRFCGMLAAFCLAACAGWAGEPEAAAGASAVPPAAPVQPGKALRLLTVGNSFSNNATGMLLQVIASAPFGDTLELSRDASLGGHTFQQHWGYATAAEADPADPKGRPYKKKTATLQEILQARPWDVVTIQQLSDKSWQPETFLPEAENLANLIRKYAPTAEVVMHQTWAYRPDAPFLAKNNMTDRDMHNRARDAYRDAAAKMGIRLIPVGEAFRRAADDPEWDLRLDAAFDPKTAETAELPKDHHGLHTGYSLKKDKDGNPVVGEDGRPQFNFDIKHANRNGCYLGALVWYGFLYGRDPRAVTFVPKGMTPEEAAILRRIAYETLRDTPEKGPWPVAAQ